MTNFAQKRCICCGTTKAQKTSFPRYLKEDDTYSKTCHQCQKEIKDGRKQKPPNAPRKYSWDSRGGGVLLLDAVWRGYASRREAATAHNGRRGHLRQLHTEYALGNTLGTITPQTQWRKP